MIKRDIFIRMRFTDVCRHLWMILRAEGDNCLLTSLRKNSGNAFEDSLSVGENIVGLRDVYLN